MKPLIDADILRYEIGFAAEVGFRATVNDPEAVPPFEYVLECFHGRIDNICETVGATEPPVFYITKGESFRDQIARRREYKATRIENKPYHYNNLTAYMVGPLQAIVCRGIEADDALAIEHTKDPMGTIICSRDKDLRQVPGMLYSWEIGKQPEFGPANIDKVGSLTLTKAGKVNKLTGTGLSFFYAQCLMGDVVDNVPGLPKWGPVAAYKLLNEHDSAEGLFDEVCTAFRETYGKDTWEAELLEQGQLLWMCRRYNPDGTPELWQLGQEE